MANLADSGIAEIFLLTRLTHDTDVVMVPVVVCGLNSLDQVVLSLREADLISILSNNNGLDSEGLCGRSKVVLGFTGRRNAPEASDVGFRQLRPGIRLMQML